MAEVFAATAVGTAGFERPVAIKRVLPGYATDPQFARMFIAEAQLNAQLSHPNIVATLDFDRSADDSLFLVMELVAGVDLDALANSGPLPLPVIVYIVAETLRGLGYAHTVRLPNENRGVVHRDVSPHNVLLSWEGAVKLSDFGLAKMRASGDASASERLKGKPAYMSPEQANGQPLDGRSDLFAVGIILWELLVGKRLFQSSDPRSTFAQLFFAPIPSPKSIRTEIPRDLDRVVMKLLSREIAGRPPTAEAALAELLACESAVHAQDNLIGLLAERFGTLAPSRGHRMIAPDNSRPGSAVGTSAPQPYPKKSWAFLAAVIGVTVAVAAVVAISISGRSGSADSTTSSLSPQPRTMSEHADATVIAAATVSDGPPGLAHAAPSVWPPACMVLVDTYNRLQRCGGQAPSLAVAFRDSEHGMRASLAQLKSNAISMSDTCHESLPYVQGQLLLCRDPQMIPVALEGGRKLDWGGMVQAMGKEDQEVLDERLPVCSKLLEAIARRQDCGAEDVKWRRAYRAELWALRDGLVEINGWIDNDGLRAGIEDGCAQLHADLDARRPATCQP